MKEWIKVARSPISGRTTVTVTVRDDNLVAKYALWCSSSEIRQSVKTARRHAVKALDEMRTATQEQEEAA